MKKIIGHYRKCDIVTLCGTISSFVGIVLCFNEHYTFAVLCLIISGICDAFDGPLSRKYEYSEEQKVYGMQLDSLSDVICFGVFPAILTLVISNNLLSHIICIFYLLCGVIRLAYFNTLCSIDKPKKNIFVGLPITTGAIVYPLIFLIVRFINFNLLAYVMPIVLLILGISFIMRVEIPKPNVVQILKKILNKYVINILLFPLFVIIGIDIFYKLNTYDFVNSIELEISTVANHFVAFLLFAIIIIIIFGILNSVFKKSKVPKIIILIFSLIVIVINDIKFNIMGVPLELSDVNYLNPDNMKMMGTATTSIGTWIVTTGIKAIIFLLIGLIFVKLDKNLFIEIKNKTHRIFIFVIGMLTIICIILSFRFVPNIILKYIYNTTSDSILLINSNSDMYNDYGFYQGIGLNILGKYSTIVEGYNAKEVNELLENFEYIEDDSWGRANVVFILSEAFSNISNIEEISFNKSLTPNIDSYELDSNKMVFDLLVPSYGGVSVNTEFEILTGASLNFFQAGFIPYTQYYNNINGKYAPNIIREFNNNDYHTVYLTPWGNKSYKSEYVYSLFDTDELIYGEQLNGDNKGGYYSDKSLMEDIFNELKETSIGNYKFIMSATGQNHYPYGIDKYDNYDIEIENTSLKKEDSNILRSYAQGIYDADKELNNLYNNIQTLEVPTIIVFYGDHLPYTINSRGDDPYTSSLYFNTKDEYLNYIRKYTTKAVILANFDLDVDDIEYMNASYLGSYVLNKMDLDISNYFKFIDNIRREIPVFNRNVVYLDEMIIKSDNLNEEYAKMLKNYKHVQYNQFYDYAY